MNREMPKAGRNWLHYTIYHIEKPIKINKQKKIDRENLIIEYMRENGSISIVKQGKF